MSSRNRPSVYIIVLNYKGKTDTLECINSILDMDYPNYRVILIDNHSLDGSEELFVSTYRDNPQIHCIQTGKNIGYAGGNNVGIKYALEQNADYICILNNDVIVNKDTMGILVDFMEHNSDIGTVGPIICEYKDTMKVQSAGANVNRYKGEHSPSVPDKLREQLQDRIIDCDFITGACMLIKAELIRQIGMIPEEYFLCWEETEWCTKIKKSGKRVVCYGGTWVSHKGGASMNKFDGLEKYYWIRNSVVYEKRNASVKELIVYYPYLVMHSVYCVLKGVFPPKVLKYYWDGLINQVDCKYKIGE